MAFEELKHNVSELDENVNSYVENSIEYAKLKGFKVSMVLVTYFIKILLIGTVALLALLLLSLAVSFALGQNMEQDYYGFLIVGLFYVVLGILCYLFRDRLNKPLLRIFSKYYFDES